MEQQPFYVGQKVVCIHEDNDYGPFMDFFLKKDEKYTIAHVWPHPNPRHEWCVKLEEAPWHNNYWYKNFAPIDPPRVSAIPELLKQPVEETLDVHPVKILTDG